MTIIKPRLVSPHKKNINCEPWQRLSHQVQLKQPTAVKSIVKEKPKKNKRRIQGTGHDYRVPLIVKNG